MTFLAPWFFVGAIGVAAGIAALHFIVTRQPRASVLPTARFVPDSPATAIVRDARPSDLLLMLLRMLVILATGAALARPVIKPSKHPVARLFLANGNSREAFDSVRARYKPGDAIIEYDSSAVSVAVPDSLRARDAQANLSAGLIAALRTARLLRDRADSLELVIISTFDEAERGAATDSIRRLWNGRARLVRVTAAKDSTMSVASGVDFRAATDDPLAVTQRYASVPVAQQDVRVIRSAQMSADDSTWLRGDNHVLVMWPLEAPPPMAVPFSPNDVVGGVTTGDANVVAPFTRHWKFEQSSIRGAQVIARWSDGEPAAVERRIGTSCLRSVAIAVNPIGDLVLRPEFVALFREMTRRCANNRLAQPMASASLASLAGPRSLARASSFPARDDIPSPLAPWLLGIALAGALAELVVRHRT